VWLLPLGQKILNFQGLELGKIYFDQGFKQECQISQKAKEKSKF